MKRFLVLTSMIVLMLMLVACSQEGGNETAPMNEGNNENDAGNGESGAQSFKLTLAHNLSEEHPVHLGLVKFTELVEERTNGEIKFDIFANGVLGDEREVLEQVQAGGVAITKVSAASLENFASQYAVFSLPYVFMDRDHFYRSMESEAVRELYQATKEQGFIGLTYYDSGARSFYTVDTPIMHPDDLKGLKIRVMDSPTQIELVEILGGAPTPMPYGEIYTDLQQGVVDGAESNVTVLTTGGHGEVAKAFSFNEHTRIPDIVVISSDVWDELSTEQQEILLQAAAESTEYHKEIWNEALEVAQKEAEEMGVEFYYPDPKPFREAVQPMLEKYRQDPQINTLMEAIEALQ
ncbi:tripartite ATP-independent transporter DctP family solute receptor [Caldalkalibacillus uzonensis]|uniref:Tripartite ATP-independent transporter DctP family solute receptor n=1 Tax=Caldalkalibacillus uzonensis TaxID=353224 RepID=A0ABU0CRX7_9BACI|nr:TRAP transporter substrate-binding protein [Caldalkalibacillus uzonensis]MDQ0338265.1 tripartite ATP-independent transporter DctP family solute receptor [Caldalkalibacillus uzonensis]